MDFSIELKKKREMANLSQDELAKKLDVSVRTISSWETGENVPRPKMKRKIDEILGDNEDPVIEVDRSVIIEALLRNTLKQIGIDRAERQGRDVRDVHREIDEGTIEEMNKIALKLGAIKG